MKRNFETNRMFASQWRPILDGTQYVPMPPVNSFCLEEKRSWIDKILGRPSKWYIKKPSGDILIKPNDYIVWIKSSDHIPTGNPGEYFSFDPETFMAMKKIFMD